MKNIVLTSFALIAFLSLPILGYSQSNIFKVVQPEEVSWNEKEQSQFAKMKNYKGFEKVELVTINDLFAIQKNGVVEITLDTKRIQARTFRMEYQSEKEYDWYGTTLDVVVSTTTSG